jgi:hypothetical protein
LADEVTLSELEERSGLNFGRLKDFDVLAAQPVPKSLLGEASLRLPLTGVQEAVLWAPLKKDCRISSAGSAATGSHCIGSMNAGSVCFTPLATLQQGASQKAQSAEGMTSFRRLARFVPGRAFPQVG